MALRLVGEQAVQGGMAIGHAKVGDLLVITPKHGAQSEAHARRIRRGRRW